MGERGVLLIERWCGGGGQIGTAEEPACIARRGGNGLGVLGGGP